MQTQVTQVQELSPRVGILEERANPVGKEAGGGVWWRKKSSPRDEKGDLDGDSCGISGDCTEFEDNS